MSANEKLRLAWQADRAGRPKLRDIMITLAIAEGEVEETWAERCRAKLVRERPGHFYGQFPSLSKALESDEVRQALDRLGERYPADRVQWLLLAGDAKRGTYTGRDDAATILLHELVGQPAEADVRRDAPEPIRGPLARSRSAVAATIGLYSTPYAGLNEMPGDFADESAVEVAGEDESVSAFYLSVLFSIALLLSINQTQGSAMKRAG